MGTESRVEQTQGLSARSKDPPRRNGPARIVALFAILLLVAAGAAVMGWLPRSARQKALLAAAQEADERSPGVNVVAVRRAPGKQELELPGDLQALIDSPIYARVDGYMSKRLADIGDQVTKDQLMAEIDTPELDQQIHQARASVLQAQAALKQMQANLVQAQANLHFARITFDRWKNLQEKGVFSRQDSDEKEAALQVRQAEVESTQATIGVARESAAAAEANLHRLEEMKAFGRITAPFDGIVTARNMDIGTLVSAGNGGPAREIFRVAQIDTLRIFVNVPQANYSSIQTGMPATLLVDEFPERTFVAEVERSATALDNNTRTMLVVLRIPNPGRLLRPGMYARVRFGLAQAGPALIIPGDTLVTRSEGSMVAVVGPDHRAHYRKITLGRDFGDQLEVNHGLSEGELIVVNPTDEIRDGVTVEIRGRRK